MTDPVVEASDVVKFLGQGRRTGAGAEGVPLLREGIPIGIMVLGPLKNNPFGQDGGSFVRLMDFALMDFASKSLGAICATCHKMRGSDRRAVTRRLVHDESRLALWRGHHREDSA